MSRAFELIDKIRDYPSIKGLSMDARIDIRKLLYELEGEFIDMQDTVLKYRRALNEERKA